MRLLVACLDRRLRPELRRELLARGCTIDLVDSVEDVLWRLWSGSFDAVLLAGSEPPIDLLVRLRAAEVWPPVLALLPAEVATPSVVAELLDAGADDVVRVPWDVVELHARIRSLGRRSPRRRPTVLRVGDLTLDPAQQTVCRGDRLIELQPRKFAVLAELMRYPGEILSRSHLMDRVLPGDYDGDSNVIDCYVSHLRTKVDKPFDRHTIKTVRSVGYRLDPRA